MNVMFVCTDDFTRSVIAEFCLKDFLRRNHIGAIHVASSGVRADSNITRYSRIHFEIMKEMNIETLGFQRTQFNEECFDNYDVIIGMSELHKDYIKDKYDRDIPLFNEVYNGSNVSVNIGAPDNVDFEEQMRSLVHYFQDAMPQVYSNLTK